MHLPGVDNTWADCLSRGWLEKFFAIYPSVAPFPTAVGNFTLDFSDEADPRTRSPHCDLAMSISRRLHEEGLCSRTMAVSEADGPTGIGSMAMGPDTVGAEFGQVYGSPGGREVTASFDDLFISTWDSSGAARQRPGPVTHSF